MPTRSLQHVIETAVGEADEKYPPPTTENDYQTARVLLAEGYDQQMARYNFKAEYIIAELKREILRDPGLLSELGIHRTDMV